jgi:hypothetical protein
MVLIKSIWQEEKRGAEGISLTLDGDGLIIDEVVYRAGEFVFLRPGVLDQLKDAGGAVVPLPDYLAKGRFHQGGANAGLRPYGIAQLVQIGAPQGKKTNVKKAKTS